MHNAPFTSMLRAVFGGAICAVALTGCYVHANGMQTPTPTLHGRPAVAYAVPLPPLGGLPPMLHIPAGPEREDERIVAPAPKAAPAPSRPFDEDAATAALVAVDLASCKGGPDTRGYAHARVTFGTDGRVSDVFVDEPLRWPRSVVACVSDRLATVRVGAFDDAAGPVGTWLFIDFE